MMLNDPTVLEASRVLAAKLLVEKSSTSDKIKKAFRMIVCRNPSAKELSVLTTYFMSQKSKISSVQANKILAVGEYPMATNVDKKLLAAMMRVVNTIYNLEETITKS